ncbi:MAG: hypothetical protein WKH64_14575 [Chloroflexia bacterium]
MSTAALPRETEQQVGRSTRLLTPTGATAVRGLTLSASATAGLYFALFLLLRGRSFRLTQTLTLVRWDSLRAISDALTPQSLVTTTWRMDRAALHEYLYGALALGLIALWLYSLWQARPGRAVLGLPVILLAAGVFSLPLIFLPGMFSGDIYLICSTVDRIRHAETRYSCDRTYSRETHTSYGCTGSGRRPRTARVADVLRRAQRYRRNALFANIFTYKVGALGLHLLTIAVVWSVLKRVRPELAAWGAIFYGWNPLVLLETVGSGHNDVMVALFVALSMGAAMYKRWPLAVFFLVGAAMVKLTALILLPALLLAWVLSQPDLRTRLRAASLGCAVSVLSIGVLYAPLWAGTAIVTNARLNPASERYLNTPWEYLLIRFGGAQYTEPENRISLFLDVARNALFAALFIYVTYRMLRGRTMSDTWLWLWFAYCVTLGWIWPWYFLLVIPVVAMQGPGRAAALGVGLTIGGMLFWMGWPDPPLPAAPWTYNYRAFTSWPAVIIAAWRRCRVESSA